ncbi:MAG: enoyl-CoA hydratase-related protein [Reyranellaceae bacterium]
MSVLIAPTSYAGGLILATRRAPVMTIVLNSPETRNALPPEGVRALAQALADAERDDHIRAIVITGSAGNFCGGAQLESLENAEAHVPWAGEGGPLHRRLSKPLIGAIEGYAAAEGFGLALLCDIRIVDSTAVFGVFGRRLGVTGDGTAARLPAIVGAGQAMDIILSGGAIGCDRAMAIGLATRKVANTGTRAAAEKLARELAGFTATALEADRQVVQLAAEGDSRRALLAEVEWSRDVFLGEGRQAVRDMLSASHTLKACGQRGAA